MDNQNNRQGSSHQRNNNEKGTQNNGFMNKLDQTIENAMDKITYDEQYDIPENLKNNKRNNNQ